MICTTYFLTFFSELIPPTGKLKMEIYSSLININIKNRNLIFLL